MSRTTKSKGSPPPTKVKPPPRRTKWWAYVLLFLVLALAWPAYRYNVFYHRLAIAQNDMALGHIDEAIRKLETEFQNQPLNGEVAYWLAVAHRRAGHIGKFNEFIELAKKFKYSPDEVDRQILLSWLQSGETNDGIERQADKLIETADKYSGGRLDLFIDEFYEARSLGFLANFRLVDAEVTLDHWIEVRPQSIHARMLRANVKERQLSRFQATEKEYQDILKIDPGNLEARVQFARLLLFNQQIPDAVTQYEICLESAPDDVRVQLGLAECEYRDGKKLDAAKDRLEKLLAQDQLADDRARTLLLLGEIARSQGKYELVIRYLTEATELSSTLGAAPFRSISSAYANLQRRSDAEKYLAIANRKTDQQERLGRLMEAIIHDPNNADLRFQQGEMFSEKNNQDQAEIWWKMAVRFDPKHLPAHTNLAEYYSKRNDRKLADFHRNMAAKAAPELVDRLWQELTLDELSKVRAGLPWLSKYSDLQEDVEMLNLGMAVAEGQDLESGADRLRQLAENPQLKLSSLTLLGEAQRRLGAFSAARQSFQQVLAENPKDAPAHWGLQKVCYDTGSLVEMEQHALKAAELVASDYRPRRALGDLYKRDEKWIQAIHEYQESLRLKPDQADKDKVLLDLAECYVKEKEYPKALAMLKDVKASPRKSYAEARCWFESNEFARAKKVLDTAAKNSTEHVPSLLLRADIAMAEKDSEVAEKLLSRALKLAPQSSEPHRKFAALLRLKGNSDDALAEDETAQELQNLESQLSQLSAKAASNSEDIGVRQELAVVAAKLGRDEEAAHWEAVAKGMSKDSEQAVLRTTLPAEAPRTKK